MKKKTEQAEKSTQIIPVTWNESDKEKKEVVMPLRSSHCYRTVLSERQRKASCHLVASSLARWSTLAPTLFDEEPHESLRMKDIVAQAIDQRARDDATRWQLAFRCRSDRTVR